MQGEIFGGVFLGADARDYVGRGFVMTNAVQSEPFGKLEVAVADQAKDAADGHQELAQLVEQARKSLEAIVKKATAERVNAISRGDDTKERLKAYRAAHEQQQQALDTSTARAEQLESALAERTQELRTAKDRALQLEKTIAEHTDAAQAAQLRIAALEKKLHDLEPALEQGRNAQERVKQLEQQQQDHVESSKAAQRRVTELEKSLQHAQQENERAGHRVEQLETELRKLAEKDHNNAASLEERLRHEQEAHQAASTHASELEKQVSELTKSLEEADARVQQANDEQDALTNSAQRYEEQIRLLEGELENIREQARETGGRETETVREQLRERTEEVSDLSAKLQNVSNLWRAETDRANALEDELRNQRATAGKSSDAESGLSAQLAQAMSDYEAAQTELNTLRKQVMTAAENASGNGGDHRNDAGTGPVFKKKKAAPAERDERPARVGKILVEAGVITVEQLDEALNAQRKTPNARLGAILVKLGFASEETVARALAFQRNVEFIRLRPDMVDVAATKLVNGRLAEHHCCMPLEVREGRLVLAMVNPLDLIAIEDVERASERPVEPVVATASDINSSIRHYYY